MIGECPPDRHIIRLAVPTAIESVFLLGKQRGRCIEYIIYQTVAIPRYILCIRGMWHKIFSKVRYPVEYTTDTQNIPWYSHNLVSNIRGIGTGYTANIRGIYHKIHKGGCLLLAGQEPLHAMEQIRPRPSWQNMCFKNLWFHTLRTTSSQCRTIPQWYSK